VITVYDSASETCPIFPAAAQRLHWSFARSLAGQRHRGGAAAGVPPGGGPLADRIKEWLHRS